MCKTYLCVTLQTWKLSWNGTLFCHNGTNLGIFWQCLLTTARTHLCRPLPYDFSEIFYNWTKWRLWLKRWISENHVVSINVTQRFSDVKTSTLRTNQYQATSTLFVVSTYFGFFLSGGCIHFLEISIPWCRTFTFSILGKFVSPTSTLSGENLKLKTRSAGIFCLLRRYKIPLHCP